MSAENLNRTPSLRAGAFEATCLVLRTAVGTAASFPSSLAEYDLERAEDAPARRAARVIQAVAPLTASLLFVAYVLIAALTVPPASADVVCGNESIREAQTSETLPSGTTYLPDCMALEMVSPPQKGAQNAKGPAVSADGARVKFVSIAALGGTPGVFAVGGDPYVASRGSSGWTTAATAPPGGMFRAGWEHYVPALSFTPDFSGWFQIASTLPQLDAGTSQAFRGGLGGFFAALSPPMTPLVIDEFSRFIVEETKFQGASADHSHLYFVPGPEAAATTTAYLPGDPEPNGNGADHNTYVARPGPVGEPSLELLARDRDDKIWGGSCGARVGGLTQGFVSAAHNGQRNQGAISADGSRVYLSARPAQPVSGDCDADANKLRILERLESSEGVQIEELFSSECSRVSPPCSGEGDDLYQGASVDGTKVYFTTNRQLADSDLDSGGECSLTAANPGCDLYLYDSGLPAGQRLVQVSAGAGGPTPGDGANVYNGIAAVSGDGSHAYFVAQGVLTGENAEHKSPTAGQPNLYLYERDAAHPSGRTAFVGTLDSGDSGGLWGGEGTFRNGAYPVPALGENDAGQQIGGDGHLLLFQSRTPLTADDSDGTHRDIFRYDAAAEQLTRISTAAPPDEGPFDTSIAGSATVPGTDFAEQARWTSEDGETIAFTTTDGLLADDLNGVTDSYLWHGGQLTRLPGTADGTGKLADLPVLSHDGSEVAFQTFAPLLPQDGDTAIDVYVARAGGGFANQLVPLPCNPLKEGSCRRLEPDPPAPVLPNPVETGNPKKPKPCRKGKVRRHGRCVARHQQKKRHRKHGKAHRAPHANSNRRAG